MRAALLTDLSLNVDIPEPGTPKGADLMPVVIAHSHSGFGTQQKVGPKASSLMGKTTCNANRKVGPEGKRNLQLHTQMFEVLIRPAICMVCFNQERQEERGGGGGVCSF
jgi:hypothetical protein